MLASAPKPPLHLLLGKTTPRIFTPPLVTGPPGPCGCGCALTPATSKGFLATEFATETLGIPPLPWQRWLFIHALELLPDGRFRFRTVLVLVARQNGKTKIVEIKNLFKMFVLGVPLVLTTAQDLDTAEETWAAAKDIIEGHEELAPELEDVVLVNGKKTLKLASGSRWKVRAASRRGGRGLSGDDVGLDELREHLNWESWAAVTKTTTARPASQIWAYSNAGDKRSVVLNDLQAKGRVAALKPESASPGTGLFEWSAPDDIRCDCERKPGELHGPECRMRDPEAWAQANPALGYTISVETLQGFLDSDPDQTFLTEHLCVRVPDLGGHVIDPERWAGPALDERIKAGRPDATPMEGRVAIAIDVSPDRSKASVGAAGRRADGLFAVERIEGGTGTRWLLPFVKQLIAAQKPLALVVDPRSAAGSFVADLQALTEDTDTVLMEIGSKEYAQACGAFMDLLEAEQLRHIGQKSLTTAVEGAATRTLGDAWAWDRRGKDVDITPLVAVTLALAGFRAHENDDSATDPWIWFGDDDEDD